ncbi:MAG: FHA domain-containing protein [Desulfobacterales bacterium]|nr:FHA domain-containing protein [Desulfobacterales bacterium]
MNNSHSESSPSKEKLKALARDVASERLLDGPDNVVVVLSGLNEVSKQALLDRDLILQSFPFTFGRFSPHRPFSSVQSDLLVSGEGSDFISERHLSFQKSNGNIFVKDEESQSGSLINDTALGKNAGGPGQVRLEDGKGKITLGGPSSPFVFQVQSLRGDEIKVNPYYGPCLAELTPVETFYIRLCHYARDILRSEAYNDLDRVKRALPIRPLSLGRQKEAGGRCSALLP